MKRLLMKITGGRPMKIDEIGFYDAISGENVLYCTDYFGRKWMATSRWSWFRVKKNPAPNEDITVLAALRIVNGDKTMINLTESQADKRSE